MTTIREAEEILKQEYHCDNFLYLAKDVLLPDFKTAKHDVVFNNSIFKSVVQLGESPICDLTVYEVILNPDVQNRRVAITQEMFKILRGQRVNNALVSFSNSDGKNYRISLLTSKYEFDGDKIVKTISNPRRYSYSLGMGTKTKTAYDFLIKKNKVTTLDDLIGRFSVEIVNKEFYNEIATHFTKLVGGDRDGKPYTAQLNLQGVTNKNKYAEFAVRLIGRIVFCWFLKEKKSDAGIPLVPDNFLSLSAIKENKNYYHTMLEPLFFELLNTKQNRRKDKFEIEEKYRQIPYLNGGLFSPHNDDRYKYSPATQSDIFGVVAISDKWFEDFFNVLGQYNFTVDENTSYDVELSIDPEMLGRIFENLLAEINPETGDSARKSTGSFYTPRDIVDYMVDSSLCEYLHEKAKISVEKLRAIISYAKENDKINLSPDEEKRIINSLYTLTVLDPACGSGAFPISMLQKIVYILQEIDPGANLWFEKATENLGILLKKEFAKKFNAGSLDYIRKLTVIQNSIFGVDIQPIAVEIARLRCFLSLIIEENVIDKEDNRGVNPLPNLEFKFVIANTLLELPEEANSSNQSMFENKELMDKLKQVREEYFGTNDLAGKLLLQREFADIKNEMHKWLKSIKMIFGAKRYEALLSWEPFKDDASGWFDPEWMFGISNFSIIIANPPYVESRSPNFDDELKKQLQSQLRINYGKGDASLIPQGADLLIYFLERAIKFSGETGIITYITSNGWLNNEYGHKFQKFLLKHTNVLALVDTDYKYFENVNINTIITFFKGSTKTTGDIVFVRHHKKFADAQVGINFEDVLNSDLSVMRQSFTGGVDVKWGALFNADTNFFNLMDVLNIKGRPLGISGFSIGQGLNLSERDKYIINRIEINNFNLSNESCIPFMNKDEAGYYSWDNSNNYLISQKTLSVQQKNDVSQSGYKLFDIASTTKQAPALIMPRGIGEKHYCTKNNIAGFSDSCVDIYCSFGKREDIMRMWLFCNSSICWLLREKFGRKNLGGGLLKSEAIDLKDKPLFYEFKNIDEITNIFNSLKNYKVKNCLYEMREAHHKAIDKIVFDFLDLNNDMRKYVLDTLEATIEERTKKSKQKV